MKKTTKKISAAALALVMGATAFTGCSGSTNSTPGGTDSAASTTSGGAATGSQKKMSSNENVKSAVDNVSVVHSYYLCYALCGCNRKVASEYDTHKPYKSDKYQYGYLVLFGKLRHFICRAVVPLLVKVEQIA